MGKTLECDATVLPDGHLVVPQEVATEIAHRKVERVHLRIELEEAAEDPRDGWQILLDLPKTAGEGKYDRASEDHDRILYGR